MAATPLRFGVANQASIVGGGRGGGGPNLSDREAASSGLNLVGAALCWTSTTSIAFTSQQCGPRSGEFLLLLSPSLLWPPLTFGLFCGYFISCVASSLLLLPSFLFTRVFASSSFFFSWPLLHLCTTTPVLPYWKLKDGPRRKGKKKIGKLKSLQGRTEKNATFFFLFALPHLSSVGATSQYSRTRTSGNPV